MGAVHARFRSRSRRRGRSAGDERRRARVMSDIAARLLERLTERRPRSHFSAHAAARRRHHDHHRPRDACPAGAARPPPSLATNSCRENSSFRAAGSRRSTAACRPRRPSSRAWKRGLMQLMARPSAAKARGLMLAAIRETFEETGLLLGKQSREPVRSPGGLWGCLHASGDRARSRRHPFRGAGRHAAGTFQALRYPLLRGRRARDRGAPGGRGRARQRADRAGLASESPRCRASTCRRSRPRCSRSSPRASRPASRTTCRCRIIA